MDVTRLSQSPRGLSAPYGGSAVDLRVSPARALELKAAARDLPSFDLGVRQIAEFELLAGGACAPLRGFLGRADYERVLAEMRLADGTLWPLPLVLDVPPAFAATLAPGAHLALRDGEGTMLAVLVLDEVYERDLGAEAEALYGTRAPSHPEVRALLADGQRTCLAGRLEVLELPAHHDFHEWRATPAALRAELARAGARAVIGYPVERLLHRTHVEFAARAAERHDAQVLVQGLVGQRRFGEAWHYPLVRAWQAALGHFPAGSARLNLLELAPRLAGVRMSLLNAIVARNYGASHVVVEHDRDAFGPQASGDARYSQFSALEAMLGHAAELGVKIVPMRELVYEEDHPEHFLAGRPSPRHASALGCAESHAAGPHSRGVEIARWFSYPEVLHEWQKSYRLRSAEGLTIFFTGLSGAGKSTLAQMLYARLMEAGERQVTLLDGDIVRRHLSAGLGFSREHRDMNVLRLGFVASLVTRHGGVAICAPIAPYAAARAEARALVEPYGGFVEVYVATPLVVCEARDRKGLYARARAGLIPSFTGVSDPYEPPERAEIVIDTASVAPAEAVERILGYLLEQGYLSVSAAAAETGAPAHGAAALPIHARVAPPPRLLRHLRGEN